MIEVAVDEAGGMTGNCIVDVAKVLVEEMSEEVDVTVLIDKELEKVESCVVNNFVVLYVVGDEGLEAEKVDREKVIKVVGLRVMEGTIGSQSLGNR